MVKRFFVGVSLVTVSLGAAASQRHGGVVTILRSDERSLVFEYRPRFLPERVVRDGTTEFTLYDFVGSMPSQAKDGAGSPDLRFEVLPVGFPAGTGNVVQLISSDYEDIGNVTLAPLPTVRSAGGMLELAGYKMDPKKYASTSFEPAQAAELADPGRVELMWVGSVKVFPVQFNPATRTVRRYSRLVVEVSFGSPALNRVPGKDDGLFRGVLLNYDIARNWKSAPVSALAKVNVVSSVLASGDWYRIPITEEGVYVLNPAYFRTLGINPAAVDPRTIKIFGNGGREIPEDVQQVRPNDLVEDAIYVQGESDGRFDEGDYALFFAKSVRNWAYDTVGHTLVHYINHYSELNYYWLTFSGANGKRMQVQPSLTDAPVLTPTQFQDGVFIENELVNIHQSGKDWFGQPYVAGANQSYPSLLSGLVPNDVVHYSFRLLAQSSDLASFEVKQGNTLLGEFSPSYPNNANPIDFIVNASGSSNIANGISNLSFTFHSSNLAAQGWNDWIEIKYPRAFQAVGNYLRFRSPDNATGVVQYNLDQFASTPVIMDVTHPEDIRLITGAVGTYSFRATERAGQVSEYCAVAPGALKAPPEGVVKIPNENLRADTTDVDFIILTTPEFRAAADGLKQRREQLRHGGLRTTVVDLSQIYNEFGGGLPDITAVRDYLKYVADMHPLRQSPVFVLFFGEGSYDYKGILGSRSSFVPTWQSPESLDDVGTYASDDFFVKFTPGDTNWQPSMITGRVNARPNTADADNFVAKLIRYEDGSVQDSWKMRMVFVADDGWTSDCGFCEGTIHSGQAEELATHHTPNEFDKRKIYIAAYPAVQSASGRRIPGAYQAIIDQINDGVLITNWTGHGNPQVWAHENVFNVETSIPQLVNSNKLSVFFLATCNFSDFDDPSYLTGSTLLINKPDGGAIAVVSASRKVYADLNAALHQGVFDRMFDEESGRLVVERPSTALFLFKNVPFGNNFNDRKYLFMGDPTMRLQFPEGYANIDSINHQSVDTASIQLKALAKISVRGTVRTSSNQIDSTFNGKVLLTVNDASRYDTIVNFSPGLNWAYLAAGGTIYRGQNSVRNGTFNATFVVPKDILYADSTSNGHLVAYFVDSVHAIEGQGFTERVWVGGTENVPPDTTGPAIAIYLNSRSFRPGDAVSDDPILFVDLADSNGINTSVSGIGHRIEAWVNGGSQSRDLTDLYTSQMDDYRKGTIQYKLTGLPQGPNDVRVRAWDTHNNAASKDVSFEVSSSDQLRVSDVFNYPNPFPNRTTFTFKQNLQTPLSVTVKIYTVAGRLIQTLDAFSGGESFVRVPWDGRDRDGSILANGVYLYKLIVRTTDGRFGSEVLGKLSVLK